MQNRFALWNSANFFLLFFFSRLRLLPEKLSWKAAETRRNETFQRKKGLKAVCGRKSELNWVAELMLQSRKARKNLARGSFFRQWQWFIDVGAVVTRSEYNQQKRLTSENVNEDVSGNKIKSQHVEAFIAVDAVNILSRIHRWIVFGFCYQPQCSWVQMVRYEPRNSSVKQTRRV